MSTQSKLPGSRLRVVDVFGQAAADTEKYGQRLDRALTKAYYAAKEDDTKTVAQALAEASEHQEKINEAMAHARAAVSDLTGVPVVGDDEIKAAFAKTHRHLDVIGSALEALELAVRADDYPNASKAFGEAYATLSNDLEDLITQDLAEFCDAINPEIIAMHETDAALEDVQSDLHDIGSALVVLKDAMQHTRPKKQGKPLDDVEFRDQLEFIQDLKEKVWDATASLGNPKHRDRLLGEMEEIRSQLGVLAIGFDFDSDADRSILCETLRSTAERAYRRFGEIVSGGES